MEYRPLGRTGVRVSAIGLGCGSVGGLMVRGTREAQLAVVRHALEHPAVSTVLVGSSSVAQIDAAAAACAAPRLGEGAMAALRRLGVRDFGLAM